MKKSAKIFVSLILVAMSASTAASANAQSISASELQKLFPGKFQAIWKGKAKINLVASAGGGLKGSYFGFYKRGSWSLQGRNLCIYLSAFKSKRPKCGPVYFSGGWYESLHRRNGQPRLRFRPR